MRKEKTELSPIRIEIKAKRAYKKKLKQRITLLKGLGQDNLANAAESLLSSVLSELKALHDKEVILHKQAARRAIQSAKKQVVVSIF